MRLRGKAQYAETAPRSRLPTSGSERTPCGFFSQESHRGPEAALWPRRLVTNWLEPARDSDKCLRAREP